MRRCLYLLPLLVFSIAAFGFNSSNLNYKNHSLNFRPTATPTPTQTEESGEIILDKKVVCQPCPPGNRPLPDFPCPDMNMKFAVSAVKPENNQLKYEYTVSGGQIVGEGAKVIWDMTGAQPGTHQIRIDIGDKSKGEKRTETKTVTVRGYECFAVCSCPTLTVDAPQSPTKSGEALTFTANISGAPADITYNWKVSAGEIIEGQGTPVIRVATNSKMAGKTVKATVEIGGVCEECPKSESADASVAETKTVKKKKLKFG